MIKQNEKLAAPTALVSALTLMMMVSSASAAEVSLFPDQVYLSASYDTPSRDQSATLMEQMSKSVRLAANTGEEAAPEPDVDVAETPAPETNDSAVADPETIVEESSAAMSETALPEATESEATESDAAETDADMPESEVPAKPGFFKRMGSSFSGIFSRKNRQERSSEEVAEEIPEEMAEEIALEEETVEEVAVEEIAPEVEVTEESMSVADTDVMAAESTSDLSDMTMETSDVDLQVETKQPGFFARMGSSFSKMFSRDKSTEAAEEDLAGSAEAMDEDVAEVEAEIEREMASANLPQQEIQSQVEVIEEEAYELVTTPADTAPLDESEMEAGVADVIEAESMEMTEKKSGILSRMGKSVSSVFTFGDRREKPRTMAGELDLATQSLGAESDMFISTNDGVVTLSATKDTLPLRDFVKLVAIKNDRIAYQKMEWAIAKSGVDSVSGIYEPELTASYQYTDSDTPNTTEEEFRRSFAPTFIERNHDYSLAVESVVPTGGRVRASYTYRDIENNIQPTPIRGEEEKNYFGLSVTQPLLRGAGWRGVESPLQVAKKDQGIAKETFRQSLFQTISDAVSVYWDVYMAEKRKELRARSVEIAEGVLVDEKERARFGRSGQANVLDAESALAQRRVQLLAAEQSLFAVTGQLRNYIAGMPQDKKIKVDVSNMTEPGSMSFDRSSMLANAYLYRPEYVAGLLRAEREDVRIQFAKNNKLPQLDLVASYGLNGLAESFSDSWDDVWDRDHESVYVGVEYRMALQGNKRGKGELSAARLRKHQALLEIKAAEIAIHNSIDTAINNLESARMQVSELTGVVETNKKLLDFELAKFEAGQSNSRDLFEIEERLNRVLELELESKVNLQKAMIGAALSEGTLLQNFELEKQ